MNAVSSYQTLWDEQVSDWVTGELMERRTSVIIQNIVYHFNCSYEVCKIYYMYIRYTYLSLWVDLVVDVSSTTEILLSTLWTSSMDNGCCCSQKKGSLNYCDAVFFHPLVLFHREIYKNNNNNGILQICSCIFAMVWHGTQFISLMMRTEVATVFRNNSFAELCSISMGYLF